MSSDYINGLESELKAAIRFLRTKKCRSVCFHAASWGFDITKHTAIWICQERIRELKERQDDDELTSLSVHVSDDCVNIWAGSEAC